MSDLSQLFGSADPQPITRPSDDVVRDYYKNAKANNPSYYEQYLKNTPGGQALEAAEQAAAAQSAAQQQTVTAQASNPVAAPTSAPPPPPPEYSGPTADAKLRALLPSGFENTLIPSSADDSLIESSLGQGRSTAQSFIDNMLRRGTLSGTGRTRGLSAISAQDPTVRSRLTDVSNALLEGGRSGLRGIANEGFGAASGQSGEFFDPSPYYSRANAQAGQFLSAFPQSYTSAVGDLGALYDTSGLGGNIGAVTGPANVSYDPYAVEGGKLSTGLEESGTPPAQKKRSTSVF